METELRIKLLENEAKNLIHRKEFNDVERAMIIDELAREKNCYIGDLAESLGCGKKELYRIRKLLDAPESVVKQIKDGAISSGTVSKILYNLKDETKIEEVIDEVIRRDLNQVDAESFVARVNDPLVVVNQIHSMLWRFNNKMKEFLNGPIGKNTREDMKPIISDVRTNLLLIEDKLGLNNGHSLSTEKINS